MNKRLLAIIAFAMVVLCIGSVTLFSLPNFISFYDFTVKGKSDIATTLSGMTAPVIGIVSSILLYSALTKQVEGNNEQRAKNEIDLIFSLLGQLQSDIASFSTEETTGPKDKREKTIRTGAYGMDYFAFHIVPHMTGTPDFKMFHLWEWPKINLIINSFRLLEERVQAVNSKVNLPYKKLFIERLETIYKYQLRQPLIEIIRILDDSPQISDELTGDIRIFLSGKS